MMSVKSQVPTLGWELGLFPFESRIFGEFFHPLTGLFGGHVQPGVLSNVDPGLGTQKVKRVDFVNHNFGGQVLHH